MIADLPDVIAARRGPRLRRDRQILTGIGRRTVAADAGAVGGLGETARVPVDGPVGLGQPVRDPSCLD